MTYSEKLKDPRWQKKRLEVLSKARFKCKWCKDDKETLHVHHIEYSKGNSPWEYDLTNFLCLCETCHLLAEQVKPYHPSSVLKLESLDKLSINLYAEFYNSNQGYRYVEFWRVGKLFKDIDFIAAYTTDFIKELNKFFNSKR